MKFSLKKVVTFVLPISLSSEIIKKGKIYKRKQRDVIRSLYAGTNPFIKHIVIEEGLEFDLVLNPVQNGCVDEHIATYGMWESDLTQALKQQIKKGDIFVDAGANIGYYTLLVSSILKDTGKVYAFEPIPVLSEQIQKSVRINGYYNVDVHTYGLSNIEGTHALYVRDENIGGSSMQRYDSFIQDTVVKEVQDIQLKTLDDLLGNQGHVDVIKIDVEGFEWEVLQGAEKILERCKPCIFLEFSPIYYEKEYEGKSEHFITFLIEHGYSFYTLKGEKLDLYEWTKTGDNMKRQIDIKCTHR
jgi:FkbM family methyltransferase